MNVIGIIAGIAAIIAFIAYIGTAAFSDSWNPTSHKSTENPEMLSFCMYTFWISLSVAIILGLLCVIAK